MGGEPVGCAPDPSSTGDDVDRAGRQCRIAGAAYGVPQRVVLTARDGRPSADGPVGIAAHAEVGSVDVRVIVAGSAVEAVVPTGGPRAVFGEGRHLDDTSDGGEADLGDTSLMVQPSFRDDGIGVGVHRPH